MSDKRYVIVTAVSQFRQRYCIPVDELQKLNDNYDLTAEPHLAVEWAEECVEGEEVKEFSQHWIGEQIVDTFVVDEPRMLLTFNRDNEYLASWPTDKKIEWVNNWKDNKQMPLAMGKPSDRPIDFPTDYVEQSNLTSQKMNEGE